MINGVKGISIITLDFGGGGGGAFFVLVAFFCSFAALWKIEIGLIWANNKHGATSNFKKGSS